MPLSSTLLGSFLVAILPFICCYLPCRVTSADRLSQQRQSFFHRLLYTNSKMLTIDARSELPSPSMANVFHTFNSSATSPVGNTAFQAAMSSTQEPGPQTLPGEHRHIWIVTGPAGCGKSTVAAFLARELHMRYIEGDDVSFLLLLMQQCILARNHSS